MQTYPRPLCFSDTNNTEYMTLHNPQTLQLYSTKHTVLTSYMQLQTATCNYTGKACVATQDVIACNDISTERDRTQIM